MQRRHRKGELLFPPERQRPDERAALPPEIEPAKQRDRPTQDLAPRKAVDAAVQPDILDHRQVVVQGEALAHVADMALDLLALPRNVVPGDRAAARSGAAQPAEHPHGGGFPGAVGSEKSENLAPRDLERNAVHGLEAAETLAQLPDGYDGFIHGASVL